ncbi:MAG: hypothetical protein ACTSQ8_25815 [Candidatus Helarchaeota archaeon]
MNLIAEIYYLIFRKLSRSPKDKYFLVWFHINGALSFFLSAVKHFRRKNTRMIIVNIKAMFWQIGEAGYEWFVATIHNHPDTI